MPPRHFHHYFYLNYRSQIGLIDELSKTWTSFFAVESKVAWSGSANRFETSSVSECQASFPCDWACGILFLFAFCASRKVLWFCLREKTWVFLLDKKPIKLFLECLSRLSQRDLVLVFLQHFWILQSFSKLGRAYSCFHPRTCHW